LQIGEPVITVYYIHHNHDCLPIIGTCTLKTDTLFYPSQDGSSSSARRNGWRALLNAGVSCWGGISPGITLDFVSPEMPWPTLDELACVTQQGGFSLTPRLAVQPRFVLGKKNYEQVRVVFPKSKTATLFAHTRLTLFFYTRSGSTGT
jgi:hypothetical protein